MRGLGSDQGHRPFHRSCASCLRLACFLFFFFATISTHGSYSFRQTNFMDFSYVFQGKLQFSRTKIQYSINRHSLTLFWTPHSLKHVMQSFTIFNSSAMADHINILFYFPSTTLWKWLRWLTIALDIAHANMFNEKKVNFKDFSRPNEEIRYFSRTFTEFKDFSRHLLIKNSRPFQDCTNHATNWEPETG